MWQRSFCEWLMSQQQNRMISPIFWGTKYDFQEVVHVGLLWKIVSLILQTFFQKLQDSWGCPGLSTSQSWIKEIISSKLTQCGQIFPRYLSLHEHFVIFHWKKRWCGSISRFEWIYAGQWTLSVLKNCFKSVLLLYWDEITIWWQRCSNYQFLSQAWDTVPGMNKSGLVFWEKEDISLRMLRPLPWNSKFNTSCDTSALNLR